MNYSLSDFLNGNLSAIPHACVCVCRLVLQADQRGLGYINIDLAIAAEFTDSHRKRNKGKQAGTFLQK